MADTRQPFQIVELDLPRCGLLFGKAPCEAVGEPCYNTRTTCKDPENFDAQSATLFTTTNHGELTASQMASSNWSGAGYLTLLVNRPLGLGVDKDILSAVEGTANEFRVILTTTGLRFLVMTINGEVAVDKSVELLADIWYTVTMQWSSNGAGTDAIIYATRHDLLTTQTVLDSKAHADDPVKIDYAQWLLGGETGAFLEGRIGGIFLAEGGTGSIYTFDYIQGDGSNITGNVPVLWLRGGPQSILNNLGTGDSFSGTQTLENYESPFSEEQGGTIKTYSFCSPVSDLPVALDSIPALARKAISISPSEISQARGIGVRASATVSLYDFPDDDRLEDPYFFTRGYLLDNPDIIGPATGAEILPWILRGTGAMVEYDPVSLRPDGAAGVAKVTLGAVAAEDYDGLVQQLINLELGNYDASVYLKAADTSSIGDVIDLWQFRPGAVVNVGQHTLTSGWVKVEIDPEQPIFSGGDWAEPLSFGRLQVSKGGTADRDAVSFFVASARALPLGGKVLGTYFGRLIARQRLSLTNRRMRVYDGFLDDNGNFYKDRATKYQYLIESFDLPDRSGVVKIEGKDPIKRLSQDRAKAPRPSTGRLLTAIDDNDLAATLTPSGVGDDEYAASGTLRIGSELIEYTRVADALTFTLRGARSTTAASHSAGDSAQDCLVYVGERIEDILEDIYVNYAGIAAEFLDLDEWADEGANFPSLLNGIITEPRGTDEIVQELLEQTPFEQWWDERQSLVRMKFIGPPSTQIAAYTDELHFVAGQTIAGEDQKLRVSRVLVYYDIRNPTGNLKEARNYRQLYLTADLDSESASQYERESIKTIYAYWLGTLDEAAAAQLASSLIVRFAKAPRTLKFVLDADKAIDLWAGDIFAARTKQVQAPTGANENLIMEVTSARILDHGSRYEYEALEYDARPFSANTGERLLPFNVDQLNVNLYQKYVELYGTPDPAFTVRVEIRSNVIIGSVDPLLPAFKTGDGWPDGILITLYNFGRIQGAGGEGGRGSKFASFDSKRSATPGGNGGLALLATYPIDLDNDTGEIWGGGGGGGGGSSGHITGFIDYATGLGGSGGGGAGLNQHTPSRRGGLGGPDASSTGVRPQTIGDDGTPAAGGEGGRNYSAGGDGGDGGGPAEAGANGQNHHASSISQRSFGGAPGAAIQGSSFITDIGAGPGSILGAVS